MGQEILYCYKCQTRLLGSEFEKGKAFKVGGKASCAKCVQDLLASMPEAQAEYDKARNKIASSARVQAASNESGSGKYKPATVRTMPAAPTSPAPPPQKNPMILVAIVGAALLVILVAMMMGSKRTPVVRNDPVESPGPLPPAPPAPPKHEDPRPPVVPPSSAYGAELRELDEKMRTGLAKEEFRAIADLLAEARKKRATPEWLSEIDLRIPQVEARVRRAALPLREKGLDAVKRKDDAELKRLRDKIAAWGFPAVVEDFNRAMAETPPPPPPPVAGSLAVYGDALAPGWMNMSWDVDLNLTANDFPLDGSSCIHVVPKKKWGSLCLVFDKPLDTRDYPWVTFAVRVGDDNPWIGVTVWDKAKPVTKMVDLGQLGGLGKPREWKKFVLPISTFAPSDPKVTAIAFQFQEPLDKLAASIDGIAFLKTGSSESPPTPPANPPPSAEAPFVVYHDALGPGCRDHSWSSLADYAATSPVFEGARSIAFTPQKAAAGLYLGIDQGLDPQQYPFVTFAIYVAEDYAGVGVAIYSEGAPSAPVGLKDLGGAPAAREWKKFTVPVAQLNANTKKMTGLVLQVFKTSTTPAIYVDSVSFLKGSAGASTTPKPPSKDSEAWAARWTAAAAKAALRDYAGAQKELEEGAAALKDDAVKAEAAADLELVKLAAQVPGEAVKTVDKWIKGQKVHVEFLNGAGERETVEGTVLSSDGIRLTLLREGGPMDLPIAELLPSTLAELFRARADRKATDARAAAGFCLFEGDAEAAKKHWGESPIPPKLLTLAKPRAESETAARRTFWAAETEFAAPRTRAAAVEKYTALFSGELSRLKPYIAARLEAARDTIFLAEDVAGTGTFILSGGAKLDVTWTSSADGTASTMKTNYVEAEFAALPGAAYKAWVWAGACCLETFEFAAQASELTAPNPRNAKEPLPCEPGGDNAITAKAPALTLRKWHAQHGGPKEPQKWDWFPVALPKYEAAGPKKFRVLTAQQGFTVGAIVISSSRRDTPRETEIKDLEKLRGGGGVRRGPGLGIPGSILYEVWHGIDGNNPEDLTKSPLFAQKPAASSMLTIFETPKDTADRFGARMRGFVHPPVSGAYTFWIASDDNSELYLSTDDSPLKKRAIARCTDVAGVRDWTRVPTCKSAPIVLAAGKRYYIEALHKEGGGGDHCAVGWTLPDGAEERPIPGTRLSAWNPAGPAPTPPAPANLTFFRGYNINGQPVVIDGRKWEGKGAQTLATAGEDFDNTTVPVVPPTDDARASMLRNFSFQRGGSVAKVYQVPPGSYQVYLYVWEDTEAAIFDIFLQNKEVMKGYNSGSAGHWEKVGPWTAIVTEGILELRTSGGDANLSGLEIWKVGK